MNLVILIGNIGQDVEITTFENGGRVARTSLATNESYIDKNGQKVEVTEWHNLEISGKLIDIFDAHVKKGDKIRVNGKLKTSSYEKENIKHFITKVRVFEVQFLSSKNSTQQETISKSNDEEEDLPF